MSSTVAGMRTIGAIGGPFLPHDAAASAAQSTAIPIARPEFRLTSVCCHLGAIVSYGLEERIGRDPLAHVGRSEAARVDGVAANFVVEDAFGRVEQACGLRAITARRLQRVLD